MALNFDVAPYFDDTAAPNGAIFNNYMRILFRPSKAVQARELTALQSILQNQISQLGGFIFQNGSPVSGGHISVDTSVVAIQLQSQYANTDIILSNFLVNGNSTLIVNATGSQVIKAYVVAIDSTQANPTLLLKYLTSDRFVDSQVIQVATGLQTQAQLIAANSSNPASVTSINEGVFYSGGFFVQVNPQTIVLDSTTNIPTYRVGLQIQETIVDEITDSNLLDPAQGSFNYQAPGATRYQYVLQLAKRTLTSTDDSAFYELLRVENGLITKQIDYPVFADLDKTLAQRTFDSAGNFTVSPFLVNVQDNVTNANQYVVVVSPGKAYVKGFEFHTIGTQKLYGDKALATNTITDYGMSLEFGNILTVANVFGGNSTGIFDIPNFQQVDLHVVPSGNISTANAAAYGTSKMGTARVRDLEFLGLGQYFAYVTEVNVTPNSFIATAGSSTTITLPAIYSLFQNAYANVTVTVNTAGIIDSRKILSYNSVTQIATLDRPLSTVANSTSNCALYYSSKDLESLVIAPAAYGSNVYYNQQSTAAIDACMDIALSGKDIAGNTVLADTQFNKLIFPLGQSFVAQNTITNASFYHRKNLWSQTFTSANLTITSGSGLGSGESFPYGFTNAFLPDNTANANFIVIVRNAMSSNLSNGQIINFNKGTVAGGNGVFETDSTHATIATSSNNTFIGDVIFTVLVTNATSAAVARRTKTLVGNSANTVLLSTDSYLNGTQVIGNTTTYIDTANGYVWYTSNSNMALTPGANQSLYVADAFAVTKVFDSGNTNFQPNVTNAIDITNNYYLNSGQKDNYYDHASLILKTGVAPPSGQTVVFLQYFSHDSVLGFFDADSYSASIYNNNGIPYYVSPVFGVFTLRDCIDFRPTRTIGTTANVQSFNLTGLNLPQPDHSMVQTYQFYLPRVDKLLLSKDKVFRIKQGTPAQNPLAPTDSADSMTLYVLSLPPFTANVKGIGIQYIDNRRYTMRDIGALDKRIQQLEYYSALSQLETQATNEKILYQDNVTAKDNYGIVADDFGGFSIADVTSTDLLCFLQQGTLAPYQHPTPYALSFQSASSNSYQQNEKTFSLAFTETPAVVQNTATDSISVQPFLFSQFTGYARLTPETDPVPSSIIPPTIITPVAVAAAPVSVPPVNPPPPTPTLPTITSLYVANTKTGLYNVQITLTPAPGQGPALTYVSTTTTYLGGGTTSLNFTLVSGNNTQNAPTSLNGTGLVNILTNWYGRPTAPNSTGISSAAFFSNIINGQLNF